MTKDRKVKIILLFILALIFLAIGASFHGYRVSEEHGKFIIGVIVGITMIISSITSAIFALVLLFKKYKKIKA